MKCVLMKRVLASTVCVLIGVLAFFIVCSSFGVSLQSVGWVQFVPNADQVELVYWRPNVTSYMNVSITFSDTGYEVSDWGVPIINGTSISADAQVLRSNGTSIPVITVRSYSYNLGNLSVAEYVFTFKAWGFPVKDTRFVVPEFSSVFLLLFMITTLLLAKAYRRKR